MSAASLYLIAPMVAAASAALISGALAYQVGRERGQTDGRAEADEAVRPEAFAEGRDEGFADGFAEGRDEGLRSGESLGVSVGYRDGHADGVRIGRAEALMRTQAAVDALVESFHVPDEEAPE